MKTRLEKIGVIFHTSVVDFDEMKNGYTIHRNYVQIDTKFVANSEIDLVLFGRRVFTVSKGGFQAPPPPPQSQSKSGASVLLK